MSITVLNRTAFFLHERPGQRSCYLVACFHPESLATAGVNQANFGINMLL